MPKEQTLAFGIISLGLILLVYGIIQKGGTYSITQISGLLFIIIGILIHVMFEDYSRNKSI